MLRLRYISLLSVTLRHSFYEDQVSRDVEFIPLASTLATLAAFGLRYRNNEGRLLIYQQVDENGVPDTPIDLSTDLVFTLRMKTDLLNITSSFGKGQYWFSNLDENGVYKTILTKGVILTVADELPAVYGLKRTLNFLPNAISSIHIETIVPGTGWKPKLPVNLSAQANSYPLEVAQPGMYKLVKNLTGGGTNEEKYFCSDELVGESGYWSLLHLQLQPGMPPTDFTIQLSPRTSVWRYYLVEPQGRINGPLAPGSLSMKYSAAAPSRYPPNIVMNLKAPGAYPADVQQYVNAIKAGGKIQEVYLFETADPMEILDGQPPQVNIQNGGQAMATNINVPGREIKHTDIIYKL